MSERPRAATRCLSHVRNGFVGIKHGVREATQLARKKLRKTYALFFLFSRVQFFSDLPASLARYFILESPYTSPRTRRVIFRRRNTGEVVIFVVGKGERSISVDTPTGETRIRISLRIHFRENVIEKWKICSILQFPLPR